MTNVIQLDSFRKTKTDMAAAASAAGLSTDECLLFPAQDPRLEDLMRAGLDLAHYGNFTPGQMTAEDARDFASKIDAICIAGRQLFADVDEPSVHARLGAVEAVAAPPRHSATVTALPA
ncbi:MAG: hypothetical protein AAGJ53_03610 [Pseudomonadota bacterium]